MELSSKVGVERGAQAVATLPPLERQCLAVLAALGTSQTRSALAGRLQQLSVRHAGQDAAAPRPWHKARGRTIATGDLKPMLEHLRELGSAELIHDGGETWLCAPAAAHAVLGDPACAPVLVALASSLEHASTRAGADWDVPAALERMLARARIALYTGQPERAEQLLVAASEKAKREHVAPDPLLLLFAAPAPAAALSMLPQPLCARYLQQVLLDALSEHWVCTPDTLAFTLQLDPVCSREVLPLAAMQCALAGMDTQRFEARLADDPAPLALEARAVCALRRGAFDEARALASAAFEASRGPKSKRQPCLSGPLSSLLTLALCTGGASHAALGRAQYARLARGESIPDQYLGVALLLEQTPFNAARVSLGVDCLDGLGVLLAAAFNGNASGSFEQLGAALTKRLALGGAHWLAAQTDTLRRALAKPPQAPTTQARAQGGLLLEMYEREPAWARALTRLEAEFAPAATAANPGSRAERAVADKRLVFLIRVHGGAPVAEAGSDEPFAQAGPAREADTASATRLGIEPRLQTQRGQGWTSGRPVALRTLATTGPQLDYVSAEDGPVLARIRASRTWHGIEYVFGERAALGLIGHPRVYWADGPQHAAVEVVTRPPRLCVERRANGVSLRIEPIANNAALAFERDLEGRLVVIDFSPAQVNLQRAVAELPPVPPEGEARLRRTVSGLASGMVVHSELGLDASASQAIETLAAECRPVVQLQRAEPGLRIRVRVRPLGPQGPELAAGTGVSTIAFEIGKRRVQCERDLGAEQAALALLLQALPQLESARGGAPLHLDAFGDCLHLLRALGELGEAVLVEWLDGKPVAVVGEAELASLRLSVVEKGEWLAASGTVRIDEAHVLDLMQALAQRTADGRFLALGEDRYLALSAELAEQLSALQTASRTGPGTNKDALELSPMALGFVSPWLKALKGKGGLKLDRRTKSQLERIDRAYASTPELPATFECELRAYQQTGYEFLARLASFGAGACLADDMGLGKTPMTLALLLTRAHLGPALCIAPLSVRANWFDEALRFAPTLRMRRLEGAGGVELEQLEAYEVLVVSYNVMALRIEQLERVHWSTLVLDEAQAIKNGATQRSVAARRLVADARIALTGTPVENHLGDLHGIMGFLNPGLLGSAKQFEQRFGKPIQRDADAHAAQQLRALIAPFVLRRRKSEVLRELPPRTEITLRVEPGEGEQAFSEALRRNALARLSQGGSPSAGSAISILAEITRLRRAACHPQLIDAQADVGAAKLERLLELVAELRDGGHRALIFSQFVDFLSIVRERLKAEGFTFQYLDGSTSEAARRKAVIAFQAGEAELFLISLKAGGFGLNLTAADYVIHLDPWWNPAVEAQASDRAHRIGQERPVTIYRLVNAASIEERVLALHERKRALAEELLRESGDATRLDPKALMALLEG